MKLRFVFDATPLIHLAKARLAPPFVGLEGEKLTVPAVVDEVAGKDGDEFEHADAGIVASLIDEGVIQVRKPAPKEVNMVTRLHRDIHGGEAEVLALAKELEAVAVVDDRVARSAAKIQGVRLEGTYGVVLRAARKGAITVGEAEEDLDRLVSSGWRCDTELYAALRRSLKRIGRARKS